MPKYRRKLPIEAFRFGHEPVPTWWTDVMRAGKMTLHSYDNQPGQEHMGYAMLYTREGGKQRVDYGNWVVLDRIGGVHRVDDDVFTDLYERVDDV